MSDDATVLPLPPLAEAIELRHLRAFVAVAEELNFSRAAGRLYISQPALSRQIRNLERLIGCELFHRSTQRVQLTLAGESLLARARPLLAEFTDTIAATRAVGGELATRMSRLYQPWVTASHTIANLDQIRVAAEELHAQFAPPPDLAIAPVIAGGTQAFKLTPPQAGDGLVLFLHGGGHIAGSAFGYRHLAGAIAAAAGQPAVVVDYRLAPEHPFPAGLDDVLSAYHWILGTGQAADRITIVADSSAGGLALSAMLSLRELGMPQPAGAALLCPWIDLSGRLLRPPMGSPILFQPEMARVFADAYLAGHANDDPIIDPLRADLSGLPPLLIHSASGDSVYQEAQLLAKHATECGLTVTSNVFPVPTHAFHIFWSFQPEAAMAIDQIGQFIGEVTQPNHQSRRTGNT